LLPGIAREYGEAAERLASMVPSIELAAFAKNGSDAVSIALRLARIYTARSWVLSSGYHGWDERVLGSALGDRAPGRGVADFGYDLDALERALARHGDAVAAVLVTPEPAFFPPAWLEKASALARAAGALFICDEVRCGLRVAPGGAHHAAGIRADLVAMSKGLANGYPLAAVGGRREVMDASRDTFVFGTHYAESVSLAAAVACLGIVEREASLAAISTVGAQLGAGLDAALAARGVAAWVLGPPSMPTLVFEREADEDAFYAGAAEAGVLFFQDDAQCPSAAHGVAEIEETLEALDPLLASIGAAAARESAPSERALRRVANRRMIAPEAFDERATRANLLGLGSRWSDPTEGSV
jgi:glutamate-1-semialdehyde aminotransferase